METTRNKDNRGYELDALARKMERAAEVDYIRWANAKKRRAWTAGALRLDDCLFDENGDERENSLLSDNGRGAELIRRCGEPAPKANNAWRKEFRRVFSTLNAVEQGIVLALSKDSRPQVAARMAWTNRMRVYRTIAKLRKLLATAHSLWLRRWE